MSPRICRFVDILKRLLAHLWILFDPVLVIWPNFRWFGITAAGGKKLRSVRPLEEVLENMCSNEEILSRGFPGFIRTEKKEKNRNLCICLVQRYRIKGRQVFVCNKLNLEISRSESGIFEGFLDLDSLNRLASSSIKGALLLIRRTWPQDSSTFC